MSTRGAKGPARASLGEKIASAGLWLSKIPIAARIYVLVVIGLLSLAGGVAVHFFSDSRVAHSVAQMQAAQSLAARADAVFAKVLRLELEAGQFVLSPQHSETQFAALLSDARTLAEEAETAARDGGFSGNLARALRDFTPALTRAGDQFAAYSTAARAVGLDAGSGARARLAGPVQAVESELSHWPDVGGIVVALQKVKRFEQEFLTVPSDETAGRLRKAANELDFAVFGGPFGNQTKTTLSAQLTSYSKALKAYVAAVAEREKARAELADTFGSLEKIAARSTAAGAALAESLVAATQETRSSVKSALIWGFLVVGVLVTGVSILIARSIYRPLQSMGAVMLDLADGDDAVNVPGLRRRDEIGVMARSLETLRTAVGEAFRLQQMVEVQPARVMLCEPETYRITYANKAAMEILGRMEKFMHCRAEEAIGRSLLDFHKNPSFIRNILQDPANLPYKGKFRMGDLTIENSVNGIYDKRGRYLGAMLNWADVSAYVQLADDFEKQVKLVAQVVGDASGQLASSARSMAGLVDDVRGRSGAAARSVRQSQEKIAIIHESTGQLTEIIGDIEHRVGDARGCASTVVGEAENAARVMEGLQQAVGQISAATQLISTIANQTNLLALNATIEAARAGDAGKGFAVVANEVKGLATETARATEDIGSMIAQVQTATQSAVVAIQTVVEAIGRMNEITSDIALAVDRQGAFTRDIAASVTNASEESGQMANDMSAVMAAMGQAADAAGVVRQAADDVSGQASGLDRQVTSFLQAMQD